MVHVLGPEAGNTEYDEMTISCENILKHPMQTRKCLASVRLTRPGKTPCPFWQQNFPRPFACLNEMQRTQDGSIHARVTFDPDQHESVALERFNVRIGHWLWLIHVYAGVHKSVLQPPIKSGAHSRKVEY